MDNLKVCDHCLMAIESREGNQATVKHYIDSDDTETKCDWCGNDGRCKTYKNVLLGEMDICKDCAKDLGID